MSKKSQVVPTNIANPTRLGSVTQSKDIAKALLADAREVFMKNLDELQPQWKDLVTVINSDKAEEIFRTVGNLQPAVEKAESKPITYGIMEDGFETKIKPKTISNGVSFSYESVSDEKIGLVDKTKTSELARTMNAYKEKACAKLWDNVTKDTGADGVSSANAKHPLLESELENNNLVEGEFSMDTYNKALNLFNNWKNHYGDKFDTTPDKMIAHRDRQTQIMEMYNSVLIPYKNENTKNVITKLSVIFNTYINQKMVHILDTTIDTAVLTQRETMKTSMEFDGNGTLDYRFAAFERYGTGIINPGFGFVTIKGE